MTLGVMLNAYRGQQLYQCSGTAEVRLSQKCLMRRTGRTRGTIWRATKELRDSKYILPHVRDRKGRRRGNLRESRANEFDVNTYSFLRPTDAVRPVQQLQRFGIDHLGQLVDNYAGAHLINQTDESLKGRNLLYRNGLQYFSVPRAVVTETKMPWCMANLSASEFDVYVAVCWVASRQKTTEIKVDHATLREVSGVSQKTYQKALDALQNVNLIWVTGPMTGTKDLTIYLCDPESGDPIPMPEEDDENDPANWFTINSKGVTKKLVTNTGSADDREKQLRASLPLGDSVPISESGEMMIHCPYHDDRTPSCSVSPAKRVYYCHGCKKTGWFSALITKLNDDSPGQAIQRIATAAGKTVEFQEPPEQYYDYMDAQGKKVLKRVLRLKNKRFAQCRPVPGGWINNTDGVGPVLYNHQLLKAGHVVCITEGEKDSDSITQALYDTHGIIGVTSGGAKSWDPCLAKLLQGQIVTITPDHDDAGAGYAAAVAASLTAEGIAYRTLSFAEYGCKDVSEFLVSRAD